MQQMKSVVGGPRSLIRVHNVRFMQANKEMMTVENAPCNGVHC